MTNKRLIPTIMLTIVCMAGYAQTNETMVIERNDGSVSEVSVDAIKRVYFKMADVSQKTFFDENYNLYIVNNDTTAYEQNDGQAEFSEKEKALSRNLTNYATKMLMNYDAHDNSNTALSPLCATMLYSLSSNFLKDGNDSNSKNIYKEELGLNAAESSDMNSYCRKIASMEYMPTDNNDTTSSYSVNNSMWLQKGATVYNSFLSASNSYHVKVKGIDFASAADVSLVNDGIQQKTKNNEMGISSNAVSQYSSFVTSTLSFSQQWEKAFNKKSGETFYNAGKESVDCNMLYYKRKSHFAFFDNFKMVELPYKGGSFSMYVMLPNDGRELTQCLTEIYKNGLDRYTDFVSDTTRTYHCEKIVNQIDTLVSDTILHFMMPEFKVTATTELNTSTSYSSDIRQLFETNLPMVSPDGFTLGNIFQSCSLDVNSLGTTATAQSQVVIIINDGGGYIGGGVAPLPILPVNDQPIGKRIEETIEEQMHADRPFAVFIKDNNQGTIPFAACIRTIEAH